MSDGDTLSQGMPLLVTKLYIPPARPGLVLRPRLMERLNAGLAARLILISAPAGSGKTTLLSAWRATPPASETGFAWVSLDEGDNDPARFWAYFIAALQQVQAGVGEASLALLRSPQPPPVELVMTRLINEISSIATDFVLALDDYHVIQTEYIHACLAFLLDHLPPQMHLALASREDPPWPLARLRGRGQVVEVRAPDLRFTLEETTQFLNETIHLDLAPREVAALETSTEGWIAGLQMVSLSMQGRRVRGEQGDLAGFIAAKSDGAFGGQRQIAKYLVTEVLRQQSEPVQTFLLHTSILNRLCGPLCEAVTEQGDGASMLHRLEAANLFLIPMDDEGHWYRYHHLFAEMLRQRLAQLQPGRAEALHRRAAAWYEPHGFLTEAVEHALAGSDFTTAARLIEQNYILLTYRGQVATVQGWLAALPSDVVRSRPRLCIICSTTIGQTTLEFAAMDDYLQAADRVLSQAGTTSETRSLRGMVAAERANVASWRRDVAQALEQSRLAFELLPEDDTLHRHAAALAVGRAYWGIGDVLAAEQAYLDVGRQCDLVALAGISWGGIQLSRGHLRQAMDIFRTASENARKTQPHRLQNPFVHVGTQYMLMGAILYEWNDLDTALAYLLDGAAIHRRWNTLAQLVMGYCWQFKLYLAHGDKASAERVMHQFEQVAPRLDPSFPYLGARSVRAMEADLRLAQGNVEAAVRWADSAELSVDDEPHYEAFLDQLTLARVRLAQGRPDEALRLLPRLQRQAETQGRMGDSITTLALQALVWQARGDAAQASHTLQRALTLAEPEGYIRTFVDEGAPMARLLTTIGDETAAASLRPYVHKLLAAFPSVGLAPPATTLVHASPSQLLEPLSEREMEVLRLIAVGLANREIAEQLHITVGTVKTHVNAIFGKLEAHNRTQAVARARALMLLTP